MQSPDHLLVLPLWTQQLYRLLFITVVCHTQGITCLKKFVRCFFSSIEMITWFSFYWVDTMNDTDFQILQPVINCNHECNSSHWVLWASFQWIIKPACGFENPLELVVGVRSLRWTWQSGDLYPLTVGSMQSIYLGSKHKFHLSFYRWWFQC